MPSRVGLITIIGRPEKQSAAGTYRTAVYHFDRGPGGDAFSSEPTLLSGWALFEMHKPEYMIILGTKGSRWEILFDSAIADMNKDEEQAYEKLLTATEHRNADQSMLEPLTSLLSRHLNAQVSLRIIPDGKSLDEQFEIFKTVAGEVEKDDHLVLDLTHGFRHIPFLMFSAALFLKNVKGINIDKVYSSFHSEETGKSELFDIAGLLEIADWSDALSKFETNDDASIFAPLLERDHSPDDAVRVLKEAGFAAQTYNYRTALVKEKTVANQLSKIHLIGMSGVFQQNLISLLRQRNAHNYAENLFRRAEAHLRRKNYDRAAIVGDIAFIAALSRSDENCSEYAVEHRIRADIEAGNRGDANVRESARRIHRIRNCFAHLDHHCNFFMSAESLDNNLRECLAELRRYLLRAVNA